MKGNFKLFYSLLLVALFAFTAQAQNVFESTKTWGAFDHSAWKIEPQSMQNYVIMGNKFFEPANNTLYMSEFSEFAQFNSWNRVHATTETMQTFWKSFCKSTYPVGYFAVASINNNRVYAILTNATGHKMWDRITTLPFGMQYGGVCPASNGGYVACGSTNSSGELAVTKFDAYGVAQWTKDYPVSGFAWTIKAANGGGYVIAGTRNVIRIDVAGDLVWTRTLNLPTSPDGSAYSYTEFEEILPLSGENGFIVTGSAFSNSNSGVYTARLSWNGTVIWSRINDVVNTSGAGTPVCWVNNAVLANGGSKVITSWRRGLVSPGGGLFAQTVNIADGAQGVIKSLNNTIPVQEAFATRAHGRLVIGGTRGSYSAAYAYANTTFLNENTAPEGIQLDETNIENVPTGSGFLTSVRNAFPTYEKGKPVFEDPIMTYASRTSYQDLTIFPNPSTGLVYVGGVMEVGASLRVFDLAGRLMMEKNIQEGDSMIDFDLSGQAKGIYTVQMVGTKYNVTRKFVIQ